MALDQQPRFRGTSFPAREEVWRHTSEEMTKNRSRVVCPTSYPWRWKNKHDKKVQVSELRTLLLPTRKGVLLNCFLEEALQACDNISQAAGSGDLLMPRLLHLYPRTAFRGTHTCLEWLTERPGAAAIVTTDKHSQVSAWRLVPPAVEGLFVLHFNEPEANNKQRIQMNESL